LQSMQPSSSGIATPDRVYTSQAIHEH
jgi:hypothetical protein